MSEPYDFTEHELIEFELTDIRNHLDRIERPYTNEQQQNIDDLKWMERVHYEGGFKHEKEKLRLMLGLDPQLEDNWMIYELTKSIESKNDMQHVNIKGLGKLILPKKHIKIRDNGDSILLRKSLVEDMWLDEGSPISITEFNLTPLNYYEKKGLKKESKSFKSQSNSDYVYPGAKYCHACQESPCQCSDPERTSLI